MIAQGAGLPRIGNGGWVATGDGSPAAPTDPDVRDGRIRLLDVAKLRGVHTVNHARRLERVTLEQAVELDPVHCAARDRRLSHFRASSSRSKPSTASSANRTMNTSL